MVNARLRVLDTMWQQQRQDGKDGARFGDSVGQGNDVNFRKRNQKHKKKLEWRLQLVHHVPLQGGLGLQLLSSNEAGGMVGLETRLSEASERRDTGHVGLMRRNSRCLSKQHINPLIYQASHKPVVVSGLIFISQFFMG